MGSATSNTPVRERQQLIDHIATGEKPRDDWRIGTEQEKFALTWPALRPLHYRGEGGAPGILTLLDALENCCGFTPYVDAGEVIALNSDDGSITLEPGGQVELSGQPYASLHDTSDELQRHLKMLSYLESEVGVRWLWAGAQPVWSLDDIGWMPKVRYEIMRRYLPTRGSLAHYMMKTTCTVQANLDYADEVDMGRKLRMSMGVSSIVNAMFASSPFKDAVPSGFKSWRARIWHDTDNDRSGLLPWVFDGALPTYERYVRYAEDVPLFFISRGGDYLDCAGLPWRRFFEAGHQGHAATMDDWVTHLSTLFPDVRIKTYMEMRSADCVPPDCIMSLPALWKGLCYDDVALDAAWDLVKRWTFEERVAHRFAAAKDALQAPTPAGYATTELARELLDIATFGLKRLSEAAGVPDESVYLEPIAALTRQGQCPADKMLAWYHAQPTTPTGAQLLAHLIEPT